MNLALASESSSSSSQPFLATEKCFHPSLVIFHCHVNWLPSFSPLVNRVFLSRVYLPERYKKLMNCHCMSSVLCYHTPGAKSNTPLILHHVFPLTFHSFFFGSCFPRYFFPVNNGPSISLPFLQLLLALFLFGMALVVTRASENNNDNVGFFQNQW